MLVFLAPLPDGRLLASRRVQQKEATDRAGGRRDRPAPPLCATPVHSSSREGSLISPSTPPALPSCLPRGRGRTGMGVPPPTLIVCSEGCWYLTVGSLTPTCTSQVPEEVWERLAGSLPPPVKAAARAPAPTAPARPRPGLGGPAWPPGPAVLPVAPSPVYPAALRLQFSAQEDGGLRGEVRKATH